MDQFGRYMDFEGGQFDAPPAMLVNNADWLLELRYIEFLRDIGRHFSVNEMLAAETYKQRLDTTGLNFVEFNYRIVQAYDFLHLFRELGCTLQMGGSDQWGNIVAGVDLIRRVESGEAFGLVTPLLTTAAGEKMGKSEGNSVWLDAAMTSPYDYYQYWVNVDDSDVDRLLRLYTFLPDEQIDGLTKSTGEALREAKRVLAHETTRLTHGQAAADEAAAAAAALFGGRGGAQALADDASVPSVSIARSELGPELTVAEAFVRAGLATSRGDARRLASQGGLSIDDRRVEAVDLPFAPETDAVLLRAGKKRFRRIVIS
jgi:tyrosyl-tRNA synthetase